MASPDSPPPGASDAETIRHITTLIRTGRIEDARPLLARLLQHNPQSEEGWLLLSMTVRGREKQIDCLHQVLRINPDHQLAKSRLAKLTRPPTTVPPPTVTAPPPSQVPPGSTAAASVVPPFIAGELPPSGEPS